MNFMFTSKKTMGKLTENLSAPRDRAIHRAVAGTSLTATLLVSGCSHAPTLNILGSYFPAWIICGVIGILLASLVRWFFVRIQLEDHLLWPLIVVYPCLTAFFTFTLWLLFFS